MKYVEMSCAEDGSGCNGPYADLDAAVYCVASSRTGAGYGKSKIY